MIMVRGFFYEVIEGICALVLQLRDLKHSYCLPENRVEYEIPLCTLNQNRARTDNLSYPTTCLDKNNINQANQCVLLRGNRSQNDYS